MNYEGQKIPNIVFMYREGDEEPEGGGCPIGGEFVPTTADQLFGGKRVIVFSSSPACIWGCLHRYHCR